MLQRPLGWYCSYFAAQLVTGTSERKKNHPDWVYAPQCTIFVKIPCVSATSRTPWRRGRKATTWTWSWRGCGGTWRFSMSLAQTWSTASFARLSGFRTATTGKSQPVWHITLLDVTDPISATQVDQDADVSDCWGGGGSEYEGPPKSLKIDFDRKKNTDSKWHMWWKTR